MNQMDVHITHLNEGQNPWKWDVHPFDCVWQLHILTAPDGRKDQNTHIQQLFTVYPRTTFPTSPVKLLFCQRQQREFAKNNKHGITHFLAICSMLYPGLGSLEICGVKPSHIHYNQGQSFCNEDKKNDTNLNHSGEPVQAVAYCDVNGLTEYSVPPLRVRNNLERREKDKKCVITLRGDVKTTALWDRHPPVYSPRWHRARWGCWLWWWGGPSRCGLCSGWHREEASPKAERLCGPQEPRSPEGHPYQDLERQREGGMFDVVIRVQIQANVQDLSCYSLMFAVSLSMCCTCWRAWLKGPTQSIWIHYFQFEEFDLKLWMDAHNYWHRKIWESWTFMKNNNFILNSCQDLKVFLGLIHLNKHWNWQIQNISNTVKLSNFELMGKASGL